MYRIFAGIDAGMRRAALNYFRALPLPPHEEPAGSRYHWRWLPHRGYVCPVGALLYLHDPSYPNALLVTNPDDLADTILGDRRPSDLNHFTDDYDAGLVPDLAVAMGAATRRSPAPLVERTA